jgi:hypothetical protein
MPVTGIIAAAGIGAAGSLAGASMQSSAAQNAAQQQAALGYAGLAQQKQLFGVAQSELQPFINAGQTGVPYLTNTLNTLQSLTTPGSNAATALEQMPGFQFQSQWGTRAAQNALTAQGLGGSTGPLATAISQYNQGLAGTYYQNSIQALQGNAGIEQNLINSGANAASALAGGAISSGNAQAGTLANIGSAQAAGTLGSANAIAGGLTGATGSVSNAFLLSSLFNNGGVFGSGGGLYVNQDNQVA